MNSDVENFSHGPGSEGIKNIISYSLQLSFNFFPLKFLARFHFLLNDSLALIFSELGTILIDMLIDYMVAKDVYKSIVFGFYFQNSHLFIFYFILNEKFIYWQCF